MALHIFNEVKKLHKAWTSTLNLFELLPGRAFWVHIVITSAVDVVKAGAVVDIVGFVVKVCHVIVFAHQHGQHLVIKQELI